MSKKIFFEALTDGEFCSKECPRLIGTTDDVPEFVRKSYPNVKVYRCQFFGGISKQQIGTSFKVEKPKRAKECMEGESNAMLLAPKYEGE